jgi:hypothetical protein
MSGLVTNIFLVINQFYKLVYNIFSEQTYHIISIRSTKQSRSSLERPTVKFDPSTASKLTVLLQRKLISSES